MRLRHPSRDAAGSTTGDTRVSRRSWRDWYVWLVAGATTAFCLGPSLVGARTLISVNALTQWFPWRAAGDDALGHEVCSGDTIDAVMPGIAHIRTQLFGGHLASWQNLVAGGSALSSVPDLGLLDPLSLPYLVLPLWLAPAFVVLLTWVAAIGGTYLFLRRYSLSKAASCLAGLIYAFSGFMVMWTNWSQTRVAALIPLLFWALERVIARTRAINAVLLALVLASMLLGGFPEVTGYALYLAGGYTVVRLYMLHRHNLRRAAEIAGAAAGGVVLGAVLSAIQMYPFLYWYRHASLAYRSGDTRRGLPASGLITLIAPNSNGLCIAGRANHGASNSIELVAYVGAAAIVLAVAGAAFGLRRPRSGGPGTGGGLRGYFLGASIVILILGWGSPSLRGLVASLPAFSGNYIGRIRSVLGFTLAILAAIGFDWATAGRADPPDRPKSVRDLAWPAAVCVAAVVTGVLILRAAHRAAFSGGYLHDLERASWIPAVLFGVSLAVVGASRASKLAHAGAFLVIPVLVAAQGAQFFHTVVPGDDDKNFYPVTPAHQFLAANLGHDRFASSGETMYPATSLYYGLRTPTGHAFHEPAWQDLLKTVDPTVMRSPTFSDFGLSLSQATAGHQPVLDRLGVKYFVSPPGPPAGKVIPVVGPSEVGSAGGPVTCSLPSRPLRGITVRLAQPLVPPGGGGVTSGVTIRMTLSGQGAPLSSGRYLLGGAPAGALISVGVAGEDLVSGALLTASFTVNGSAGPMVLEGSGTTASCSAVTPLDDGLKLVHADPGSLVYQRLDALPRIRWASATDVVPDSTQQVEVLAAGLPPSTVVLSSSGPAASGAPASIDVTNDSGDRVDATVDAAGSGYLVVADAMQQAGWSVTVDGRRSRMVPADHAIVAVAVPAGTHRVAFVYTAPDQEKGALISLIGVFAAAGLLWWDRRRSRAVAVSE